MLMFFNEGFGGLPGFGFEFEAIDRSGIILVFIKRVTEFMKSLKGKIGERSIVKEGENDNWDTGSAKNQEIAPSYA